MQGEYGCQLNLDPVSKNKRVFLFTVLEPGKGDREALDMARLREIDVKGNDY